MAPSLPCAWSAWRWVAGVLALTAIGCGGRPGIRYMRAETEWSAMNSRTPERFDGPQPTVIRPDETFRLSADGPRLDDASLQKESGVSSQSWFLVDERSNRPAAAVLARSHESAHSMANAVQFRLTPAQPLAPGDYTLVLLLDRVRWPLVHEAERSAFAGAPAIVRRYRVAAAAIEPGG